MSHKSHNTFPIDLDFCFVLFCLFVCLFGFFFFFLLLFVFKNEQNHLQNETKLLAVDTKLPE